MNGAGHVGRWVARVAIGALVAAAAPLAGSTPVTSIAGERVLITQRMPIGARAMASIPGSERLVVATIDDGPRPSSILLVDARRAVVVHSTPLPSPAIHLELSGDGRSVFAVGYEDPTIRQFDVSTLELIRAFTVPTPAGAQGAHIVGMASLPGTSDGLAVIAGPDDAANRIVVLDAGRPRTRSAASGPGGFGWIEAGATSTRVYAVGRDGLTRLDVSAAGASALETTPNLPGGRMTFWKGRLYVDEGTIVDAESRSLIRSGSPLISTAPTTVTADGAHFRLNCEPTMFMSCHLSQLPHGEGQEIAFYVNPGLTVHYILESLLEGWGASGLAFAFDGDLYLADPQAQGGNAGEFHPLDPARVVDTRLGLGSRRAPLVAGETIDASVAGTGGVPALGEVSAVVVNVTATNPTSDGYLSVWPAGTPRPVISSVNFRAGETVPNLVTVPVGTDGRISIFNERGSTDVLLDVAGYYSTIEGTAGSRFHGVVPDRLVDSRIGLGLPREAIGTTPVDVQLTGRSNVPLAGPRAVAVNVTVTNPTAAGYLSVYPAGIPAPTVSNLNFVAGRTVANMVIVRTGPGGMVTLANSAGRLDVIVDIVGYFDEIRLGETGRFFPVAPYRQSDTRFVPDSSVGPEGRLANGGERSVSPPGWASAGVYNITATGGLGSGYLTAGPASVSAVPTSIVNYERDRSTPNHVIVAADEALGQYDSIKSSRVTVVGQPVHVIVDVFGAFT